MPPSFFEFVRLWTLCQGGMGGIATWPDDGGLNHQPAWLVDAFHYLGNFDARLSRPEDQS